MKISKKRYLQGFGIIVVLLGMARCIFPDIASSRNGLSASDLAATDSSMAEAERRENDSLSFPTSDTTHFAQQALAPNGGGSRFFNADGTLRRTRIYSVPNFGKAFPDQNDVQLIAAQRLGVSPVNDRDEAMHRISDLVYVGSNPYFYIDRLHSSIPYLVPKASILLQDIGRAYFDSLQMKGIPLHKIIVTSVMRSKADVVKLRGHNSNATQNSCHLYGTTFDVCYNRYKTVEDPSGKPRHKVRNDTLKWVLSEVLNDMRKQNRCLIKYEVHQGCFHITVK